MQRRIIGLCGGIGSGKSARLKRLVDWWAASGAAEFPHVEFATTDADKVGHACYEPGSVCYKQVVRHFGDGILSSDDAEETFAFPPIDRKKLGAVVFGTGRMPELNAIVWPAIAASVAEDVFQREAKMQSDISFKINQKKLFVYVVEAAILPHMPQMLDMCDEVWLFSVEEKRAVERVMARNGVSAEEALRRVKSQSTAEEKAKLVADGGKPLTVFDTTNAESDEEFKKSLEQFEMHFKETIRGCPK